MRIRGYFLKAGEVASKNVGKPCYDGYSVLFLQPPDAYGNNDTEFLAMSSINLRNVPTFELSDNGVPDDLGLPGCDTTAGN